MADSRFVTRIKPSGEYSLHPTSLTGAPMREGRAQTGPHIPVDTMHQAQPQAQPQTPHYTQHPMTAQAPTHGAYPVFVHHPNTAPIHVTSDDPSSSMVRRTVSWIGDSAKSIKLAVVITAVVFTVAVQIMGQISEMKEKPSTHEVRGILREELTGIKEELQAQRVLLEKHEKQMNTMQRINVVIRYLIAHARYVEDVLRAQASKEKIPPKPEVLKDLEAQVMVE